MGRHPNKLRPKGRDGRWLKKKGVRRFEDKNLIGIDTVVSPYHSSMPQKKSCPWDQVS